MHRFRPQLPIILSLTLLSLVAATPETQAGQAVLDRLEASVNSSIILNSDVNKFRQLARLRAQLDPLFSGTPLASKGASATKSEIIDFLIDDRLITLQYPYTDSEVEQEINSIQVNN